MPTKPKMTGWYDPVQLTQDRNPRRNLDCLRPVRRQAGSFRRDQSDAEKPFDASFVYSRESEDAAFWFDFIADTGDGWDSTYAMASLLAEPELRPAGTAEPLARGRLLVMGGDQVYPTASVQGYADRLIRSVR